MAQERRANLPLRGLPMQTRMHLEDLLSKHFTALSEEDLAFLKARRDYLSVDQREYFGVDEENKPVRGGNGKGKQEDDEGDGEGGTNGTDTNKKPVLLTIAKAKAELLKLGIAFDPKATREQLNELLK